MASVNPLLSTAKQTLKQVLNEGKLKGREAIKETIERLKKKPLVEKVSKILDKGFLFGIPYQFRELNKDLDALQESLKRGTELQNKVLERLRESRKDNYKKIFEITPHIRQFQKESELRNRELNEMLKELKEKLNRLNELRLKIPPPVKGKPLEPWRSPRYYGYGYGYSPKSQSTLPLEIGQNGQRPVLPGSKNKAELAPVKPRLKPKILREI